jgi:hypothetical protein
MDNKEQEQFTDKIWFVVSLLAVGALILLAIYGVFV